MPLSDYLPEPGAAPDDVLVALEEWVENNGWTFYEHQENAIVELLSGNHVVVDTPTGSGKSMIALAAQAAALTAGTTSVYTAPVKALVNEKFFDLVSEFGADNVGMLTGDVSVNPDAPVLCCTAEILAFRALREGRDADIATVVMDEFHFYSEPGRGWAWQVPLLRMPHTQFVLMSATLGDMSAINTDLERRTDRPVAWVRSAERPVPLDFRWSLHPLDETIETLVESGETPIYVVHFTQLAAIEHAVVLTKQIKDLGHDRSAINAELRGVRWTSGFGKTLRTLLQSGVGVHHAGMLPRYRRLVERLSQQGLLRVICGTDTLGVGVNVPIRTVLFSGLAKFDGQRERTLKVREFKQIAGRAGRAGFDTHGTVTVQAPEHVIANLRLANKAKGKKKQPKKAQPRAGAVVWTEETFDKLVSSDAEALGSRMKVDHAMLMHLLSREDADAFSELRPLLMDNHEPRRRQLELARRAIQLVRGMVESELVQRIETPAGPRYALAEAVEADFALNQQLTHFGVAALDLLDAESDTLALDIVSVIEATLESPRQILYAQVRRAKDEAMAQMRADGLDYDERMAKLDEITWPEPLAKMLDEAFETYRETHPWLHPDDLAPKSIVREMWESGMGFSNFIAHYSLSRSEGVLLRYLTDSYRTLRRSVPQRWRTPELDTIVEWLGETIRFTDSSLLEEWQQLRDGRMARDAASAPEPTPEVALTHTRGFAVMVRNAMWRRIELMSRDDVDALAALELATLDGVDAEVEMDADAWDEALGEYYDEYSGINIDADARSSACYVAGPGRAGRHPVDVIQIVADPDDDRDWAIAAEVLLDASDERGEAVVRTQSVSRRTDA